MRKLFLIAIIFLASCTFNNWVDASVAEAAKVLCASHGGLSRITQEAYDADKAVVEADCIDGTHLSKVVDDK